MITFVVENLLNMKSSLNRPQALIFAFISLLFFTLSTSFTPPAPSRISMKMESKILAKGKATIINAELYYQYDQGKLLTRYLKPLDYMFFTNNKGEAKIYYPTSNEVMMRQSAEFNSEKGLLYFFLANKLSDLGLGEMGFKIMDTRFDDGLVISTWNPPGELLKSYSKVELVHESYRPIFIAYYDKKGKVIQKIFYYEYTSYPDFSMPLKVVQTDFMADGDSSITKITYSDIKIGDKANSNFFNFKIPVNAKVKKQ
jgi:outer membrane lipoprotein-sorting protein